MFRRPIQPRLEAIPTGKYSTSKDRSVSDQVIADAIERQTGVFSTAANASPVAGGAMRTIMDILNPVPSIANKLHGEQVSNADYALDAFGQLPLGKLFRFMPVMPTRMGAINRNTREELITKLKSLQAKADSTTFPEEARLFRDKAQELIQKYQVTDVELGIRVAPVPPPQQRPSPPQTPQPPQRPTPQPPQRPTPQTKDELYRDIEDELRDPLGMRPLSEEERVKRLQSIRQQQAKADARIRKEQENFMKKIPWKYRR